MPDRTGCPAPADLARLVLGYDYVAGLTVAVMRNYGISYDTGLTADGDCTRKRFEDAVVQREQRANRYR